MTPFELDLLRTVWPYLWTGILGAGTWFLKAQNARLDAISKALSDFSAELARVEKQLMETRADHQHRIDKLIGDADARISRIEAVCETQHDQVLRRRSTDARPVHWAQTSDINGNKLK